MSILATDTSVRVRGLSKRYRIGARHERSESLAGALAKSIAAPVRNFAQLRSLRRFRDDDGTNVIWALRDVGFELAPGEVLGVIGRNGAGKSTLLKILSRITEPTEGEAVLRGRVASLLEVGTGFHGDLTGRENIFLNGTMLGMRRKDVADRFDEIVEFAGIDQYIDTPVKRYSSGMGMRLAFSVAAHVDPDVLIADEVLAVGDAEFQRKCLGKMREVATSGRTVIFVSHNQAAIASLCTRALWLERGRTRMDGPVDEVASRYLASVAAHDEGMLARRTDRGGSGVLRFTRAEVLDGAGNPVRTLVAGETAVLALSYAATTRLRTVEVLLFIDSSLGERVATFSNELTGDELAELPAEGRIVCRLDRLPLNGGDYSCSLKAKVNGDTADQISDAIAFTVDATRFYPTRRHPTMQSGPLLVDGRWGVEAP